MGVKHGVKAVEAEQNTLMRKEKGGMGKKEVWAASLPKREGEDKNLRLDALTYKGVQ